MREPEYPRGWSKRRIKLERAVRAAPFDDLATCLAYIVEDARNPLGVRLDAARYLHGVAVGRAITTTKMGRD